MENIGMTSQEMYMAT